MTQERMNELLDGAIENGYEDIINWPAWKLAEDIHEYASECEGIDPRVLQSLIQNWLNTRRSE